MRPRAAQTQITTRVRLLALGGVIGPLTFMAAWVVAGAVSEHSSPIDDAISDLAAVGASTRVVMTVGFVLFGLGLIAFGIALRGALEGPAWIAAIATGACTLGVAATPLGGWSGDTVHGVFASLGYVSIAALPLLASTSFARRGRRGWALASRLTALAAAFCLVATTVGPAHGLWQRVGLAIADAWIAVVALVIATMNSSPANRLTDMEHERVKVSTTIEASPESVFAVLADPSAHPDIDGTGWVQRSLDGDRITAAGQVFRMAMYHENHPDKDYKIANLVEVFDAPRAIAWKPGTESPETGELSFGGWTWRYDLEATGPSQTAVTLTYDWSAVGPEVREYLQFPPFEPDHLDNSLRHLSDLVRTT